MDTSGAIKVVFLPGSIMPAAIQYAPLLNVLIGEIQPILKDLEVYSHDVPPPGYDLNQEVDGLRHFADSRGLEIFHLAGYSGGGVVALAFVAAYPHRIYSLVLSEPAVIPSREWLQAEDEYMKAISQSMLLPSPEQMREFMRINLRPGVQLPPLPPGEPPAWMAKRPAGLRAMVKAFESADIDLNRLRSFHNPVYLAVGSLSNAIEERKAEWLAKFFSDFKVVVYDGRHHFDPPQRAEPKRFAKAALNVWKRAEQISSNAK